MSRSATRALEIVRSGALGDEATEVVDVKSIDDYQAEVDDLQAAILDETPPRVNLAFSRGSIATLVALDRAARCRVAGLV